MHISRRSVFWCVILLFSIPTSVALAEDGAELPPPPDESLPLSIDESAAADATLPPPPEFLEPEPVTSATAPTTDPDALTEPSPEEIPAAELTDVPPPVDENFPPFPEDSATSAQLNPDLEPANVPATQPELTAPPAEFSSSTELMDLGMKERLNAKELVLWLYFGGSYGSVAAKGVTTSADTSLTGTPGGMGYSAGMGWMLSDNLQMGVDFVGSPRTTTTTVDSAMLGLGLKFGFISVMAMIGAQSGEDIVNVGAPKASLLAYGARGGLDIILSHSKDSRVSYGISPEVYYITPQTSVGGYNQIGATVSFRIYGYENAF